MRLPKLRRPWQTWLFTLVAALAVPGAARAQTHLDNPFVGATMYVNPDYTAKADAEAAKQSDATLAASMRAVGRLPSAVWMDRIAAVPSLATHLDNALAQGANLFLGVVYDLPGRDCAALASNGELPLSIAGLNRYKAEYIDVIADTARQAQYAGIRIVFVVEPDSLPNLVTNSSDPECAAAKASQTGAPDGIYVEGVRYAINTLHAIPNVYLYVDSGHSGWLGWPTNASGWVSQMNTVASGLTAGKGAIEGFVDDTANTLPLREPFMTATTTVGGQQVMNANFYQSNPDIDEVSFATDMYSRFTQAGWPASMGFLQDSSRNGWGGAARPTGASTSTDMTTFVNATKIDRRAHRGLWCNPAGAGIGERPQAAPSGYAAAHFDAFVWVKPPGESDGASTDIPNDQGKKFDRMCDPTYTTQYGVLTGALPNAPLAGDWFPEQFTQLVQNAYPPIGPGPTCTAAPAAPGSVSATASSSSAITLTWGAVTPPASCSVTYSVYRSTTSGFTPSATTLVASGLTAANSSSTGLTASTTYYFRVQAVDAAGSATSAQAQATTQAGTNYTLTVAKAGAGSGTVTSSPAGVSCGSTCSAGFSSGTAVTLTAAAASGSTFTGWSGACVGTGTCTVTMTAAQTVTATFGGGTPTFTLTVAKAGTGSGTVTSSPAGVSCGSTCSASFSSGTSVTLTPAAGTGSTFAGWSGACSGTGACAVSMTAAQSVTATFDTTGGSVPCANAITLTSGNSGNFNTAGAACYRTSASIAGWGCYNMDGRTVSVDNTATTCGTVPLPAKWSDGYHYFFFTAGTYPWAGFYFW